MYCKVLHKAVEMREKRMRYRPLHSVGTLFFVQHLYTRRHLYHTKTNCTVMRVLDNTEDLLCAYSLVGKMGLQPSKLCLLFHFHLPPCFLFRVQRRKTYRYRFGQAFIHRAMGLYTSPRCSKHLDVPPSTAVARTYAKPYSLCSGNFDTTTAEGWLSLDCPRLR